MHVLKYYRTLAVLSFIVDCSLTNLTYNLIVAFVCNNVKTNVQNNMTIAHELARTLNQLFKLSNCKLNYTSPLTEPNYDL